MIKLVFWGLVALDVLGILTLFVLGLAAAGSARTNPAAVALTLLVLPAIPLAVAVVIFLRSSGATGRVFALLIAASPLLIAFGARAFAVYLASAGMNEEGEMTFFRSGPMREIAEAITRNDSTTVASLAKTVNVNRTGIAGMTLLGLAMRQLSETPEEHAVLRVLLEAGADPNKAAQYELPLAVAIQESNKAGPGPVKLLLDAGANPNLASHFGDPVWFAATGQSSTLEVLTLLLDRGANMNTVSKSGETALFGAANARNWKAALLLLERGADWTLGRSVNGMPFIYWVDTSVGLDGGDSAFVAVRQFLERAARARESRPTR